MTPTFTYFPLMGKGLASLLAMEEHKLAYEGQQKTMETWPAMKASGICPFGQLPIIETEDAGVVGQSAAVLHYIGLKTNALGAGTRAKVMSQMLVAASDELLAGMVRVQPTLFEKEKVSAEALEKFWAEEVEAKLGHLDRLADGARFTAEGNTVGELHLFATLHQMVLARPGCLDTASNVAAFYKRILGLESTQRVLEGKTPYGSVKQFFVGA